MGAARRSDELSVVSVVVSEATDAETLPEEEPRLALGQWYWHEDGRQERRLWCLVHLGSNFAKLRSVGGWETRIHFDEFSAVCERELDPDRVIAGHIEAHQHAVEGLLLQIQELTQRLALGQSPALGAGSETAALALRMSDDSCESYQTALVKAKKEELPAMFKKLEEEHESMALWMKAKVMPLKAEAAALKSVIQTIDDRIFSVELYAGLVEQVVQIAPREGAGEPAGMSEKVHLLQRRCYMDEECLARYEAGGMEFKDIEAFDRWLTAPAQLGRLLPFPKCVVSFQVRRKHKARAVASITDFIRLGELRALDEQTFLYIRNGERVFRLQTQHEFGERLFPDLDAGMLRGKLWGEIFSDECTRIITDNEYQALRAEDEADRREMREQYRKAKKADKWRYRWSDFRRRTRDFHSFDRTDVHHDEIAAKVQKDQRHHNRIALILQGLFDRSPVFHPHPPWRIWTDEGFRQALTLVYDDSRALVAGAAPDFETFRAACNRSLREGAVTVGQEDRWQRQQARIEEARRERSYRYQRDRYQTGLTHYHPYGNPGPGLLARVFFYSKRSGKCTYRWTRERQRRVYYGPKGPLPCVFSCPADKLLCVDGYRPGDFRLFFDDPRTRADYLQWAPLLLVAEDYHAGKRTIGADPHGTDFGGSYGAPDEDES